MASLQIRIDGSITDPKVKEALDALKRELDEAGVSYEWSRNMPRGIKVGPSPMPTWDIDPGIRRPVTMPGIHREIPPGTVWCGTAASTASTAPVIAMNS